MKKKYKGDKFETCMEDIDEFIDGCKDYKTFQEKMLRISLEDPNLKVLFLVKELKETINKFISSRSDANQKELFTKIAHILYI